MFNSNCLGEDFIFTLSLSCAPEYSLCVLLKWTPPGPNAHFSLSIPLLASVSQCWDADVWQWLPIIRAIWEKNQHAVPPSSWGEGLYSLSQPDYCMFYGAFLSTVTQTTTGYLCTQPMLKFPLVIHAKNRNRLSSLSLLGRWVSLKERLHGLKKEWSLSFPYSFLFSDGLAVIIFWWVNSRAI